MDRKKALLIINSQAGTGNSRSKLFSIVTGLTLEGLEVTVFPVIPKKGLVSEDILTEEANKYDRIVCSGGDGTLNHVVNCMIKNKIKVPIGYIPSGSANDFSKNLHTSFEIDDICKAISNGEVFAYDVGKFNDQYFNYVAAFGAFSDISYATNQDAKNSIGYLAYILQMISSLPEALTFSERITIEHDDKVEQGDYLFGYVSNSISVAGMKSKFLSQAELDDGVFEVLLVKTPKNIVEFNDILGSLTLGNINNKYVKVFTTKKIIFKSDNPLKWTIDGEDGGASKKTTIKVLPKAMKIMVDRKQ